MLASHWEHMGRITLWFSAMFLGLPCIVQAYPDGTVEIVNTGNAASETITVWGGGLDAVKCEQEGSHRRRILCQFHQDLGDYPQRAFGSDHHRAQI